MVEIFSSLLPLDIAIMLASPMMFAITILLLSQKYHKRGKLFAFSVPAVIFGGIAVLVGYFLGQTVPGVKETSATESSITIGIGFLFLFLAFRTWMRKEKFTVHHDPKGMKPWKWFVIGFVLNLTNVDALVLILTAGREIGNMMHTHTFLQWTFLLLTIFCYILPIIFPVLLTLLFPSIATHVLSHILSFLKQYARYIAAGMFFLLGLLFLFHGFHSFSQRKSNTVALYDMVKTSLPQAPSVTRAIVDVPDMSLWWVSPDDYSIIVDAVPGIEVRTFDCQKDTETRDGFTYTTKVIHNVVDTIMRKQGFTENQKNSSQGISDDRFYDYVHAYQRGDTKCVFTASPDCSAYTENEPMHYTFSFVCTDAYEKSYEEQIPYLRDLQLHDVIIHIDKQVGDFIKFNVNYRRSGYYLVARFIDGTWKELLSGQDIPLCREVERYQIPKELIGDCWNGN